MRVQEKFPHLEYFCEGEADSGVGKIEWGCGKPREDDPILGHHAGFEEIRFLEASDAESDIRGQCYVLEDCCLDRWRIGSWRGRSLFGFFEDEC